jgi:hypothetical protein
MSFVEQEDVLNVLKKWHATYLGVKNIELVCFHVWPTEAMEMKMTNQTFVFDVKFGDLSALKAET